MSDTMQTDAEDASGVWRDGEDKARELSRFRALGMELNTRSDPDNRRLLSDHQNALARRGRGSKAEDCDAERHYGDGTNRASSAHLSNFSPGRMRKTRCSQEATVGKTRTRTSRRPSNLAH
jgi:hypothetical protein